MKNKQEEKKSPIGLMIICALLLIGLICVSIIYVDVSKELKSVPCWTEQCVDKDVTNTEYSTGVTKIYKYKTELVSIGKMTWKDANILPISAIKGIIDPLARTTIEEEAFGITQAYVEMSMYDSDGSELYTAKQGTKPEWLEE